MTEELQGDFEDKVVELVESVSISNITLIQAELTRLFKQSEGDDDVRVDQADFAVRLASRIENENKALVLLAAALEVSWPNYDRGDGYFLEPSLLASFATRLGLSTNYAELLQWSNQLTRCEFIGFFDLGIAANPGSSSLEVMSAVKRSSIDPVIAIAASSPVLLTSQIREVLAPLESASLLIAAILRMDGWNWPEFQDAFGLASKNLQPTETLWKVLLVEAKNHLNDNSSQFSWIYDFIDQADSYFFENLEDVVDMIRKSPNLRKLAIDSQWKTLTEIL
jgi:hypothetical protein